MFLGAVSTLQKEVFDESTKKCLLSAALGETDLEPVGTLVDQ